MPPGRTLAKIGGSSRVKESQKHSARITAVLTIRGDEDWLPTYPEGPVYAVQKNAYMNQRIWSLYLREVLKPDIDCPSVVLADNLKCHVSSKSYKIMEDELFCGAYLHPLPANTTSILQPLYAGVMGPFKKMCRIEWIKEEKVVTAAEKRLAMIKVWNDMKQETVRKSFEKALNIFEI
ncbi:hypothetical protein DYB32_009523 [Aphanomyces invadans]|uniref:DDE-1 domain-containing protein n=1 Tax=Aphanomyces invadans TaxID=157072 RepID=A0A3R6Y1D5_9STRA|nr:hypothetical protein DYB32_009523 [Aphanomyces invadans]